MVALLTAPVPPHPGAAGAAGAAAPFAAQGAQREQGLAPSPAATPPLIALWLLGQKEKVLCKLQSKGEGSGRTPPGPRLTPGDAKMCFK